MIRGFYSAALGLNNSQTKLDVIANNVANIGTAGYKVQSAGFSDTLYSNIQQNVNIGSGSRAAGNSIRFEQGAKLYTGLSCDFAIDGDGFFAVSGQDGGIFYTRSGSFSISAEGENSYLVTAEGLYVLDEDLNRIEVIDGAPVARPAAFSFQNPYALQPLGGNKYAPTPLCGQVYAVDTIVMQGYLEESAVDLVEEIAKMIEAQHAFQLNSRVIRTADEMEQAVNSLR
ncbi:MAG TPA: flagellar hook-basal body protein [Candidatus Avimonas sp.]|mgnify:FL=1|jgi:flagellar basal-body rod protein FlgG|nr:flagellar hook-basal body protein [Clostridiales bacterium]HOB36041.1 flagellar hook-basal body protein [Candidatus Avimonas sp.]HQA15513.1 flagellar hook-basal body protein [Candidatus Avimonas sp.]HQD37543.1 flagellar hook-basal body protein [Candidatus Avimonas sp.]